MTLRTPYLAILLLGGLAPVRAQVSSAPPDPSSVVTVRPALSASAVRPGGSVSGTVMMQIKPGWHVNAHKPTLDFLIPTVVTLKAPKAHDVGDVQAIPIEMVSMEELTQLQQGDKKAPKAEKPNSPSQQAVARVPKHQRKLDKKTS